MNEHEIPDGESVLARLGLITAAVSAVSKDRTNQDQGGGFKFRGIDDLMNELHPLLAEHGVVLLPSFKWLQSFDRNTRSGGINQHVILEGRFTFAGPHGDTVTVQTIGQASDVADKATNKAMSAALKYALMQTFTVPTADMEDSDRSAHENVAAPEPPPIDVDLAIRQVAAADAAALSKMEASLPQLVEQGRLSAADSERIEFAIASRNDALEGEADAAVQEASATGGGYE